MGEKQFERGASVYTAEGQQCKYVAPHPEGGHIVIPLYDNDDDQPYCGDAFTARRVFTEAPKERFAADIASAEAKLREVNEALAQRQAELREMDVAERQRKTRLQEAEGLRNLDDFLAGRITHFVIAPSGWTNPSISTFDAVMRITEDRHPALRLLSLFGDEKRNLRWKMARYSDGSGINEEVIPCRSEEEAINVLADLIAKRWDIMQRDNRLQGGCVVVARQYGFPVPEWAASRFDADARKYAEKQAADARQALKRAQEQHASAEAKLNQLAGQA